MEFIALPALALLIWLAWQLIRAKRFNKFKTLLNTDIKEKVIVAIKADLIANRSELFPNTKHHIEATSHYWTQSSVRILQAAVKYEIINKKWLKDTGNVRNCQHLYHLEKKYL